MKEIYYSKRRTGFSDKYCKTKKLNVKVISHFLKKNQNKIDKVKNEMGKLKNIINKIVYVTNRNT